MSRQAMAMLACIAVLAMLVAGCGDGDEGGEPTGTALTKKEFVAQAKAICVKRNEETAQGYERVFRKERSGTVTAADMRKFANQVYFANLEKRLDELRELTPPAGDEARVTALLDAQEAAIEKAEAKKAVPYQTTITFFEKANDLARKYGLAYCIGV